MKPTRGQPNSRFGSLPRERRMALLSIALLLMLLGAIVLYQRFLLSTPQPEPMQAPVEQPPLSAGSPLQTPPLALAGVTNPAEVSGTQPGAADSKPVETPPTRLTRPLAGTPHLLKTYGSLDDAYGDFRLYTAIAYTAKPGQSVLAAAKGKVAAIEEDPVEGLTAVLEHTGGMTTRYAGLAKVLVAQGAQVEGGSIIAQTGNPGAARIAMGPHLAFAVRLGSDPVDPTPLLRD